MREDERIAEAELLLEAYRTRRPIEPLVKRHPDMTLDDAYAIQSIQTERRVADGAVIRGHKVGLTSHAMQRQIGVSTPDYGVLMDDMFYLESRQIRTEQFLQPRVEPEIAFVLARPLRGPGVTIADAVRAVDVVLPSLEIIDSRIADWKIGYFDTVADNASSGGLVLGSSVRRLHELDLRGMGCVLRKNGHVVGTGAGGAVLGSPLNALVWLANTLGEHGVELREGAVVLPGSITQSVPVESGDTVTCTFAGLGSLTAQFA
jgi:2-keto-4-pentenoate hydratase